jgi:hypothetical protein
MIFLTYRSIGLRRIENNDSKPAVISMDNDIEMDAKGDKDD